MFKLPGFEQKFRFFIAMLTSSTHYIGMNGLKYKKRITSRVQINTKS